MPCFSFTGNREPQPMKKSTRWKMNILKKENSSTLEKIILRRQQKAALKYGYLSLTARIVLIALAFWLILTQVFLITQAKGNSMFPSVKDGDLLICFRLEQGYVKDDIVIYELDGEQRTGRVVAVGSDVITFTESGAMMVNGTVQTQDVVYATYPKEGIEYPFTVPDGCVFIMGDFRTQSVDSRDFGAVPTDSIEGKVITVLRRRML